MQLVFSRSRACDHRGNMAFAFQLSEKGLRRNQSCERLGTHNVLGTVLLWAVIARAIKLYPFSRNSNIELAIYLKRAR
jgi:hypothetical protein